MPNETTQRIACDEYEALSRRGFLGLSTGALAAAMGAPSWLPRVSFAKDHRSQRDVVISIYLRGGADGLTLCVPYNEPLYYSSRPSIAVPPPDSGHANAGTDLDGQFAFPPALAPLMEAYDNGHLAVVQATGSTDPSRSHFEAQYFMEIGKPGDGSIVTGWLGRHLATASPTNPQAILRAVALTYGIPVSLWGGPKTLPVPKLNEFGVAGDSATSAARQQVIGAMYDAVGDPLRTVADNTQATINMLRTINFDYYEPANGAVYPVTPFGNALKSTAALLKAQVGVEAVAIDLLGWDTHAAQKPFTGAMFQVMDNLARSVGAFYTDAVTGSLPITVVIMSEFGRNVAENSGEGTDHGHGGVMFALGKKINGGRVFCDWPGFDVLDGGQDLQITTDYRDILAEIVQNRLGNDRLADVFPGYSPTFRGITVS